MKIPKHMLQPLKNPFVEAKRQELAIAMTKKLINDALSERKAAEKAKEQIKGGEGPVSA
jgi:hypothetical protein